ncbi:hypothetical protein SDC9_33615 [bioreactor metagenome]|jgi:hypothetical protein|uniref:Uncharacterized protein n=1 Tax=bioreactor metagenome TaxID=1076179 RepID=A0A644V8E7_9ZZZZ
MNDELSFDQEVDLLRLQVDYIINELLTDEQKVIVNGLVQKVKDSGERTKSIDGGVF